MKNYENEEDHQTGEKRSESQVVWNNEIKQDSGTKKKKQLGKSIFAVSTNVSTTTDILHFIDILMNFNNIIPDFKDVPTT